VDFKRDFVDEGLLGSGTFADVYRARERVDNKLYAVKKVKRQFRSKRDRDWLLNEVRSLMQVGETPCENIVQFVRAWQDDGYFYVQIELAARGTLRDLMLKTTLAQCAIPDSTLWHVIHDVACGLRHIHASGLVHLDIKPDNLLISAHGTIKIGDFGTASQVGAGEDGREGDTRYMAPELLQSSDRYPPADLFSLGLTLYEVGLPLAVPSGAGNGNGNGNGLNVLGTNRPLAHYNGGAVDSYLPSEGPLWHVLREGRADPLPNRTLALMQVVASCMAPAARDRPTTQALLSLPEVVATEDDADPTLLSAQSRLLASQGEYGTIVGRPPSAGQPGGDASASAVDLLAMTGGNSSSSSGGGGGYNYPPGGGSDAAPSHPGARGLAALQVDLLGNNGGDNRACTPTAMQQSYPATGYYFWPSNNNNNNSSSSSNVSNVSASSSSSRPTGGGGGGGGGDGGSASCSS
jgi:serine/threonine protein kinase